MSVAEEANVASVAEDLSSLSQLLSIKERLEENLSGNQISSLLDQYLYGALEPIVKNTNIADRVISSALSQVYSDHRRKISQIDKDKLVTLMFAFLHCRSPNLRWRIVKRMKLERTIWIRAVEIFQEETGSYLSLESKYLGSKGFWTRTKLSGLLFHVESSLGSDRQRLSAAVRWVNHYTRLYFTFKDMIIEKYVRLAYMEASKAASDTSLHVSKLELFKNMLLAIEVAIAKYSPDKGALTSYVKWWFMNAKTNPDFDHQYGQSYSISTSGRRKLVEDHKNGISTTTNLASELSAEEGLDSIEDTSPTVESDMISMANNHRLVTLVNNARNAQVAQLILEVPYKLTADDLAAFAPQLRDA